MGKVYSVIEIKANLATNNQWLQQGILAIYRLQTEDEQSVEETLESNGIGFNKPDASLLSSYAEQLLKGKGLNQSQLNVARVKMLKYAGQLKRIAYSKGEMK